MVGLAPHAITPSKATDVATDATTLPGMRVRLVEDNAINQQISLEILRSVAVEADIAQDGQAAIDRLTAAPDEYYCLVLMDVEMPILDGIEATKRIRADVRFAYLPIIAMTAHAMDEARDRCLAAGMNGYVSKPIDPDFLFGLLRRHRRSAEHITGVTITAAEFPGLNVAAAVKRLQNKVSTYHSLLRLFAEDYRTFPAILMNEVDTDGWSDIGRDVHTLKGVAANLGMDDVVRAAEGVEKSCDRRGLAVKERILLHDALTAALHSVDCYLAETPFGHTDATFTDGATPAVEPGLPDWIDYLKVLMLNSSSEALSLWAERGHELTGRLAPDHGRRLKAALEQIDFDSALAVLAELEPTQ